MPQFSHWNRLPSWLATFVPPELLLLLHGLVAAADRAVPALGDDHLGTALAALVPLPYLVSHYASSSDNKLLDAIALGRQEYSARALGRQLLREPRHWAVMLPPMTSA